ncbi:beta-aspartyl-peptidase [Domibacillus indicus]|uniref:beta-aspartyl-peptidase n=1 Tax=Domibacillus indicus TaxID=1437523 RepID=UPI000618297B|nr:beta-aspartyl-peptidase [Domibacillus indicus]
MLTVVKNGEVYAPSYKGRKDLLLAGGKIIDIRSELDLSAAGLAVQEIDAEGRLVVPGFIDAHVHLIGGGGEGGFKTRTPELSLTDATMAGITTAVGVLGTDGTTRRMESLLAKANALEEEGLTCYIHTGSYQIPVKTLTGSIESDLIFIDKIIGVGEIAISDHRSSQPTFHELAKTAAAARNGGMLSGKAGLLEIHVGDSPDKLQLLEQMVTRTDLPIHHFHPTHINRNAELFHAGIEYALKGGYVDFTTSAAGAYGKRGKVKSSEALRLMLEEKVPVSNITFSSDGQASLPSFHPNGEYAGLQVGNVMSLYEEVKDAVQLEGIPLETALRVITSNPAKILKLHAKGGIEKGKDADLVLLEKDSLEIHSVLARGRVMVENKRPIVKGTFA